MLRPSAPPVSPAASALRALFSCERISKGSSEGVESRTAACVVAVGVAGLILLVDICAFSNICCLNSAQQAERFIEGRMIFDDNAIVKKERKDLVWLVSVCKARSRHDAPCMALPAIEDLSLARSRGAVVRTPKPTSCEGWAQSSTEHRCMGAPAMASFCGHFCRCDLRFLVIVL